MWGNTALEDQYHSVSIFLIPKKVPHLPQKELLDDDNFKAGRSEGPEKHRKSPRRIVFLVALEVFLVQRIKIFIHELSMNFPIFV